jgi:periplasmic protein TonB
MKIVLVFTFSFIIFQGLTQETPPAAEKQQIEITEQASFPGGTPALRKYLGTNMRYPQRAVEEDIQGKVYVGFVVDTEGKIGNITIKKGIPGCPECDAEAKRLVETMPDWTPAKTTSGPVKSYYTLPVGFKLN